MPSTRRVAVWFAVLLGTAVACAPPPDAILPATTQAATGTAAQSGLRYEALVDPVTHSVTVSPVGMHTQATGLFVRSANAVWSAPTFSFDLLVTNNSGGSLSTVRGVVLSTTPGSPTVIPTGTNGTLAGGQPFYDYGTLANGATGSANWQFSIPSSTPFRFGFTIQSGAGVDAGPVKNNAPSVTAVTPTSPSIAVNSTTTITATTSDPNSDALTYQWSAPSGGSITGSGATITYTAPGSTGTYPVNVTIDDGKGATATGSTTVSVTAGGGTGTAQGNVSFGPTPAATVKRVTLSPATVTIDPGDPLTITATGLDNPGNAVASTWTWSQVGTTSGSPWRGTFDQGTTGNTASWRTFDGRTDSGPVTITGRSANNQTASMTVNVRNKAPVISSNTPAATCTVARNVPLTFTCVFHDKNGDNSTINGVAIVPNTNHTGYGYSYGADFDGNMTFTLNVNSFTAAGSKTLSVTNSDGVNSTTMTWNITIL
jgi:hypothetical protein